MLRHQSLLLSSMTGGALYKAHRRANIKERARMDYGGPQFHEQGTLAFDSRVKHSSVVANQLAASQAIRTERSREQAASEIIGKFYNDNKNNESNNRFSTARSMINRARELSTYANPQTQGEREYLEDEFARELQLREGNRKMYSDYDLLKEKMKSGEEEDKKAALHHLPRGLNSSLSPELKIRNKFRGDERDGNAPLPYTRDLHRTQTRRELTRLENNMKYTITGAGPSSQEYNAALRNLGREAGIDEEVSRLHEKLIDECGLYPSQRLDAYMLQDETIFPNWVNDLAPALKDRVRFGGIGLTDDDEVLRQNLARMPPEEREEEWLRLKSARAEKHGSAERKISPAELRDMRLGIRRHHQLHKKRLRRAILMKQLVQRKPEKHEVWPSGKIDYSARLATVARFVEAGVPTKGQWPLDQRQLANQVKKNMIAEEAQAAFVNAGVALSSSRPNADKLSLNENMKNVMKRLDDTQRSVKRVSRKQFARRLVAIQMGNQDEHGRKYHQIDMKKRATRIAAYRSEDEMKMNKELLPFASPDDSFNTMRTHQTKQAATQNQWEGYHPYAEERRRHGIPNTKWMF